MAETPGVQASGRSCRRCRCCVLIPLCRRGDDLDPGPMRSAAKHTLILSWILVTTSLNCWLHVYINKTIDKRKGYLPYDIRHEWHLRQRRVGRWRWRHEQVVNGSELMTESITGVKSRHVLLPRSKSENSHSHNNINRKIWFIYQDCNPECEHAKDWL